MLQPLKKSIKKSICSKTRKTSKSNLSQDAVLVKVWHSLSTTGSFQQKKNPIYINAEKTRQTTELCILTENI